jgi:hypothetical protein
MCIYIPFWNETPLFLLDFLRPPFIGAGTGVGTGGCIGGTGAVQVPIILDHQPHAGTSRSPPICRLVLRIFLLLRFIVLLRIL